MSDLVLIEVGRCPVCHGIVEAADGLEYRLCGAGHETTPFVLVDTYAMDSRKVWED